MKTIKAIKTGDCIDYAEPVPKDAIAVVFDGDVFTVYQSGDDLEIPAKPTFLEPAKTP